MGSFLSLKNVLWFLKPLSIVVIVVLVGLAIKAVAKARIKKIVQDNKDHPLTENIFLAEIDKTSVLWSFLLGTYVVIPSIDLSSTIEKYVQNVLLVVFLMSLTMMLMRIGTQVLELYGGRGNIPSLAIFKNIISVTILLVGILSTLTLLGIPIAPTLATLGVVGLAVSLALQDTLSHMIAGIQLIVDKQVNTGDYIRLASGEEGYIHDISWRTTRIHQITNNVIIVPNSALASAIVVNFHQPEQELGILFDVGVGYDSDLEKVEQVTVAVAKEVMQEVEGGIPMYTPFIRYTTFDSYSINFTVYLRGREFLDERTIKHEFIKRLHKCYRQEGIEIPFPIRTVYNS